MYKISESKPLVTFRLSSDKNGVGSDLPVTWVTWCARSPRVFYAIHGAKYLSMWDLKLDRKKPVVLKDLSAESAPMCIATNMPLETMDGVHGNYLVSIGSIMFRTLSQNFLSPCFLEMAILLYSMF